MNINFNDDDDEDALTKIDKNKITIFVKKRNNRQSDTTITGIAVDLDLKKILSYMKKNFNCTGSIITDEKFGEVLSLTGDQKENAYNFFIDEGLYTKNQIIVRGI